MNNKLLPVVKESWLIVGSSFRILVSERTDTEIIQNHGNTVTGRMYAKDVQVFKQIITLCCYCIWRAKIFMWGFVFV